MAQRGRPLGSLSKKTLEFKEKLAERGYEPGDALVDIFNENMRQYNRLKDIDLEQAEKFLSNAARMSEVIAGYCFPKMKSMEYKKPDAMEGMTPVQKLETLKEYVKALEYKIKEENGPKPT